MAMVSFGHPVHRQDDKEKPLQTQKPNHRGIMSRPTMPPQLRHAGAKPAHASVLREMTIIHFVNIFVVFI